MKPVVLLIHGYNVSQPGKTVGKMRRYFEAEGCLVEIVPYGYWPFPWQITKVNPKVAKEVADRVFYHQAQGRRVYVACHSNGAAITRLVCIHHRAQIDRILAIHPALKQQMLISDSAERVIVVHNHGDKAVVAGKVLGWISRFLIPDSWVFRPWGTMGMRGYTGGRKEYVNIDSHSDEYAVPCWGHSDEFQEGKAEYWLPLLAHELLKD